MLRELSRPGLKSRIVSNFINIRVQTTYYRRSGSRARRKRGMFNLLSRLAVAPVEAR
jgi:hypothetical protein